MGWGRLLRNICGMVALSLAMPALASALPVISGVTVEVRDNGSELVTFQTTTPITPRKYFTLEHPDRVVVDIPLANGAAVKLPASYGGHLIRGIRFAAFDKTTSRIVLDLAAPVTIGQVTPGAPLTVELLPEGAGATDTAPPNEAPSKPEPVVSCEHAHKSCGHAIPPAEAPEQKKPLIAIDAGHGGQDPGATGLHTTHERDVTLNFAQNLARALEKTGRYRALLTREDDHYILLPDRVTIARKAKADMFISLHADSNPNPTARGLSIYTLSATASDAEAAALAERENKSDIITGLDLNTTDADVANILIDLTQRETMNKSTSLADDIVRSLSPHINRLPSTHRFAGFRVLKAPDVPSVLIELGFLSNATDERLLLSADYRALVVDSVIKGVDRYYSGTK